MTRKLIFLNLLIDGQWDQNSVLEKIFEVRAPDALVLARSNEYLGRYFAEANDLVVVPQKRVSEDHLLEPYLQIAPVQWLEIDERLSNTESFADKVVQATRFQKFDRMVVAGPSKIELSLLKALNVKPVSDTFDIELVKRLNRKDYLLSLSKNLNINFPKSEVIRGSEMSAGPFLYKSLVSSGGSGVYRYQDAELLKTWAMRKNQQTDWDQSLWLKQEEIEKKFEFNCFGHTESETAHVVSISYDKHRLSYRHNFNSKVEPMLKTSLENAYKQIREHLRSSGYVGLFGFDSIVSSTDNIYPVTDLNVRMNKSHVLLQILERFKLRRENTSFFRLRFVNHHWPSFADFSKHLKNEITKLPFNPSVIVFPVDGSFWKLGQSECLYALTSDSAEDADTFENWIRTKYV